MSSCWRSSRTEILRIPVELPRVNCRQDDMGDFTDQEIAAIYRVVALRRDMRHFLPDPLDEALIERLLSAAHLAPSVGFMQPWRFIHVRSRNVRDQIHALVEAERKETRMPWASVKMNSCGSRSKESASARRCWSSH